MTERRPWTADEVGVAGPGLVVFAVSWLPWYAVTLGPGEQVGLRAWELSLLAVAAVLLSAYAALRVVWLRFRPLGPDVPLAPGVEPFVASLLAALLVLYRSLDVPSVPLASRVGQTVWMIVALLATVLQVAFAARAVARTGFRA